MVLLSVWDVPVSAGSPCSHCLPRKAGRCSTSRHILVFLWKLNPWSHQISHTGLFSWFSITPAPAQPPNSGSGPQYPHSHSPSCPQRRPRLLGCFSEYLSLIHCRQSNWLYSLAETSYASKVCPSKPCFWLSPPLERNPKLVKSRLNVGRMATA